ncbi:potassium channel family protein [Micromonospora sp. WMMD558]|uniref:potassium channel family protein n=1 Tax=unclassified Micromonospora TaxID=2617518 RepID=UPI0012B4770C|nr:potassium channel family protein [Micromonospora sp. WMMC415]QGN50864.1 two pore domain potassium channel family protein [Micromonospora sp. WMMC415]
MGNAGSTGSPAVRTTRWERVTALPLTVLSLVFLAAYAAPILDPQLGAGWRRACQLTTLAIWLLFWLDIGVRFVQQPDRRRFVREHLFDLAVLLLPVLRPLRALRLVTVVLTLSRRTEIWVRGRLGVYVAATTLLLVVVAALAVLDAERYAPDSSITSYGDALWWAAVTITTVGYGDFYPVTTEGRFVAVGLMIGGIGLIGFVTGSLATWIVDRVSGRGQQPVATAEDIAALRREIAALRQRLESPDGTPTEDAAARPVPPPRTTPPS